jgi:predicted ATPase/class 3 adenylate cyclase
LSERTHFILLTDIFRSSMLAEAYPAEYAAIHARHNAVVEGAIAAHGGRVLKGLGDGYLALFAEPAQCVACAVAVQRQLGDSAVFPDGTPLRLRVVCHAGLLREAQTAAGTDYFGSAINRASRIAQVCNPGQLLLSERVRTFLGDKFESAELTDLGEHRLRDLAEPEHLFQLLDAGFAVREHPQLATIESRPNNLIQMPGSFVGRSQELRELGELLRGGERLVTLIAPGGYGKSRVAAQLCANLLPRFSGGVFEVRLVPLTDAARIPEAIAAATGFQFYGSREPREQILDYLRAKELLLHFDNFEHLLEGAALVSEILATAPGVRIVVTSREPLRRQGEQIYRLEPLPVEAGSDAVQLFAERAALARHDFVLDATTTPQVTRICQLLDGVPLAIEFAAAWVDSFSLDELAAEMGNQLELTARLSDVEERHRSVRASCDWSWARLSDKQRSLLRRCSVFRGGFFIEAGEAVLGLSGMALRRALGELVDKSWLYTRELKDWLDEQGNTISKTRWQLRDAAAREYAHEKLRETRTPDELAAARA